ncbi:MAG: hypothetical protein WDO18_00625 [Acidobacteriota bacterium]
MAFLRIEGGERELQDVGVAEAFVDLIEAQGAACIGIGEPVIEEAWLRRVIIHHAADDAHHEGVAAEEAGEGFGIARGETFEGVMLAAVFEGFGQQPRSDEDFGGRAIGEVTHEVAVERVGGLAQILLNLVIAHLGFFEVMISGEDALEAIEDEQEGLLAQFIDEGTSDFPIVSVAIGFDVGFGDVGEGVADKAAHGTAAFIEAPPDTAGEIGDVFGGTIFHPLPGERAFAHAADGFEDEGRFGGGGPAVEVIQLMFAADEFVGERVGRDGVERGRAGNRGLGCSVVFGDEIGEGRDDFGFVREFKYADTAVDGALEFESRERVISREGDVDIGVVDKGQRICLRVGGGRFRDVTRIGKAADAFDGVAQALAERGASRRSYC